MFNVKQGNAASGLLSFKFIIDQYQMERLYISGLNFSLEYILSVFVKG